MSTVEMNSSVNSDEQSGSSKSIQVDPVGPTGSHPVIRFEQVPMTPGKIMQMSEMRPRLVRDTVTDVFRDFEGASLEWLLGETLYTERLRLKRERPTVFTRHRYVRDRKWTSKLQSGLLQNPALADRKNLLEMTLESYANEIAGNFNPQVYQFVTHAVPWGFSWLLNAASVKRFLPWGMTQSLESRLRILGEVPHLQKLAQKGTILLVPTHQSNIDSVLLGYVIYLMQLPPFAYGAGLNLFSNPILSFFMSNLGAYTVDRKKSSALYKNTLKQFSTRILEEGVHSIFFPGGGRARSGAVESKLKLGLLGTGLDAQIRNLQAGKPNPNVYVVPMVMSYHFVLEAASLIEDYLAEAGKHRYLVDDDEDWALTSTLKFFWKFFSAQTDFTVRIGKPLDVFGNFVDEEGNSIGPNGTTIDPTRWLTTGGVLKPEPQRDQEYTRMLGARLVDRFHRENTVLTSHVVAFALFESLRKAYPDLDLFRFLRLSHAQRALPYADFLVQAEECLARVKALADRGGVFISRELHHWETRKWVEDGIRQLGIFHGSNVAAADGSRIWTDDVSLLYYYRNRLSGYGLSLLSQEGARGGEREYGTDAKGFLA